jgi:exodeoxyribonuclease VII small subunit
VTLGAYLNSPMRWPDAYAVRTTRRGYLTRLLMLGYFHNFLRRAPMPEPKPSDALPEGDAPAAPPAPSFEAALAELETIVATMESGELSLEQSLASYRRGAQLLQQCQSALKNAQQQVKILEAGLLQDFAGGNGQD